MTDPLYLTAGLSLENSGERRKWREREMPRSKSTGYTLSGGALPRTPSLHTPVAIFHDYCHICKFD
ncbi:MAG: hypothetical protein II537_07045 [Bacteroidales bacterium]|nr:hypothetical protein [Bacteroidales bacterium]